MIDRKISIRYARALLGICEDESTDENRVLEELKGLVVFFDKNPEVDRYLFSYVVMFDDKKKIIEYLTDSGILREFLKYLAKRGRFKLFREIVEIFEELVYEKQNRVKAFVRSAVELDSDTTNRLKEQLSEKLNKNIDFEFEIDKDLIAGIIVQVKDVVYDGSLKTYLANLEQRLLRLSV